MNRTFWISPAVTAVACGVILFSQFSKTRALGRRVDKERESITQLERDLLQLSPLSAGAGLSRRPAAPLAVAPAKSIEEEIAKERAATTPEERIASAQAKLELFIAGIGDTGRSAAGFFKVIPDLLRIVQDLSIDEMIAVAEGIEGATDLRQQDGKSIVRTVLFLLAAEHAPERVIENADLMKDQQMRQMLLAQLARKDSKAAREWVEKSDMPEREKEEFMGMLMMFTLRSDVEAGLKLVREQLAAGDASGNPIIRELGQIPMATDQIPALVAAMGKPENAELRGELLKMVVRSAMLDGGVAAAREQVDRLDPTPEELSGFFSTSSSQAMRNEPEAMLDWMTEAQAPEQQASSIPSAVRQWARSDFNGAGQWLGKMEPSAIKDQAIQGFAQTVIRIDPQAAVIWAIEIENDELRQQTLRSAAIQWRGKDRTAAEKWLQENGYDQHGNQLPAAD